MSLSVWQISAVQFGESTIIRGIIVKNAPFSFPCKNTKHGHFLKILRSYFTQTYQEGDFFIKINDRAQKIKTDQQGEFQLTIKDKINQPLKFYTPDNKQEIPLLQDYPVVFEDSDTNLGLITDIDDTILVSHTLKTFRRIRTILFVSPHKRKLIDFSRKIIQKVHEKKGRIFYVSKSESNLFPLISCFVKINNLPQGKICLTGFLNIKNLILKKKAKDIKREKIEFIIKNSPGKRFILLGDDTQRDLTIYREITEKFPRQIAKIYIHKTLRSLSPLKHNTLNAFRQMNIPFTYFENIEEIEKEFNFIENLIKNNA